jgi:hypothetical protein
VIADVSRGLRSLLLGLVVLLLAAPVAGAATRAEILRDCETDGRIDGSYTPNQIRDARNNIPDDIDEYTDCRDVLSRAMLGGSSGGGGGGGGGDDAAGGGGVPGSSGGASASGGSSPSDAGGGGAQPAATPQSPPSPEEQRELDEARIRPGEPQRIAGRQLVPGASVLAATTARNDIPAGLVVVLVLVALTALVGAGVQVRKRVIARRQR